MKVLLPASLNLTLETPEINGVDYDEREPIPDAHLDAEVLVTWANSRSNLAHAAQNLDRLRLVQTINAGPDRALAAGFDPRVVITSGRSLHDGPVAEHALALILAGVRRLDQLAAAQRRHEWDRTFIRDQAEPSTRQQFTLDGAHVVLWGFGSIALRLAPLLTALGADVRGIATTAGTRDGYDVVATEDREQVLSQADVLVSLLPASAETARIIGQEVFSDLPDSAIFVNVGRGTTVDEPALITALTEGQLRFAALDVMETEPLPEDSQLWDAPNLLLTPHVAGGRPQGAEGLVEQNVAALVNNQALINVVER